MSATTTSTRTGQPMEPPGKTATDESVRLARSVVECLQRLGVKEVVVCAGARNAALVAVIAKSHSLRQWSFPEERSAAFFALGRCLALGAPVAVLTTSGTAAAELLPATIEAHYQGSPLVLVTADRPRTYRGTGAPQAIDQVGIFTSFVAACGDVASLPELDAFEQSLASWDQCHPLHLNVCLEEPSAAALAQAEPANGAPQPRPVTTRADPKPLEAFLADETTGPLVVVAAGLKKGEQPAVAGFLQRLGCPIIAEATSGLREHPELQMLVVHGGEAAWTRLAPGRVLRIGSVPSSRWWRDLEKQTATQVLSLSPIPFPGLARPSAVCGFPDWQRVVVPTRVPPHKPPRIDRNPASDLASLLSAHPLSEPALVHALSTVVPQHSLVFLGNSLPIREWNTFATTENRRLRCQANRGANGIDGCVSTFLGLGADEPDSWAVIGDLTALYDLAALWITPALPAGRRRLVVINNGGGRIFSRLPALHGMDQQAHRLMENPHDLKFHAWADLFGWSYARAECPADLATIPSHPADHLVVEIAPDAAATKAAWSAFADLNASTASPSHSPA